MKSNNFTNDFQFDWIKPSPSKSNSELKKQNSSNNFNNINNKEPNNNMINLNSTGGYNNANNLNSSNQVNYNKNSNNNTNHILMNSNNNLNININNNINIHNNINLNTQQNVNTLVKVNSIGNLNNKSGNLAKKGGLPNSKHTINTNANQMSYNNYNMNNPLNTKTSASAIKLGKYSPFDPNINSTTNQKSGFNYAYNLNQLKGSNGFINNNHNEVVPKSNKNASLNYFKNSKV